MTLAFAIQAYLTSPHFDAFSYSTCTGYTRALKRLVLLGGEVADVSRAQVMGILNPLSPGERAVNLTAIRAFFNWAIDQEMIENNPASKIKFPAQSKHTRQWTREEAEALMSCGDAAVEVACALAYHTGQRMGDVLKMTWGDIEGEGDARAVRIVQQKTGVELLVPLAAPLRQRLDLLGRGGPMDRLVDGSPPPHIFRYRFRQASHKLGIAVHFHGARVSCAGRLAEAGCSTREIMAIGGWKTSAMVDLYTAQASQMELARAAIRRLG